MSPASSLEDRLDALSTELDAWTRAFFERHRSLVGRFADLLSYPLGWVDSDLRPIDPPAPAGKRLRPALCLLVCEAVRGDHRPAMPPAAAVELVHNFSLIHDDIQDESPLRRGRPTVWARWGAAQAINVGDALYALAQVALAEPPAVGPTLLGEAVQRLNLTCLRLVTGQYLDLELQSAGEATLEDYQTMIGGKTAALLECSAWLGARFGGAEPARAERFAAFGSELGLVFQLQDDVLGVWGDPAVTGKPADTDLRTRKQALPAVLALGRSGPEARRFGELFAAPGEMTVDEAVEARHLLELLGIREEAERMVEAGYVRAEAELSAALGDADESALRTLLARFRQRVA